MLKFDQMITCIDAHTAGEPLRIFLSDMPAVDVEVEGRETAKLIPDFPSIKGNTILEKREYVLENYDHIRKMLMLEPRGHAGMYGCIVVPPVTEDGDFGVLFTHNEGLSYMCGHGIIAITKVAIEIGLYKAKEGNNTVKIDSPSGRITSFAEFKNGKVERVRFENVPSFVYKENFTVPVEGYGDVPCVVGSCGPFYVYVESEHFGLEVCPENVDKFIEIGMKIKYYVQEKYNIVHPTNPGIFDIYGTIFTSPLEREGNKVTSKNVCIFAEGQVDRSPTGTGTAGRVAILAHQGLLKEGDILVNKSIIDTEFEGKILERTKVDEFEAVVPEVSGTAYIMGFNHIVVDPQDSLQEGFRLIGG